MATVSEEVKVVYEDDGHIRAIRGVVEKDPVWPNFIVIHRRDGVVRLRIDTILRVEEWEGAGEERVASLSEKQV